MNVAELLDQAEEFARSLGRDDGDNPSLALGAALGAAALAGRDKVALIDDGTGIIGLGDWAEQLIAESTGKEGKGILPVVVETPTAPGATGDDVLTVTIGGALAPAEVPGSGVRPARRRSTGRSARSSWPGRRPPRWPAGCSASTRSTSPT